MIKLSFKNPYLIIVFALAVAVLAIVLIPRTPVDILPAFKKSAMQILTLYPGMPAMVVEKDITSRMERWTGQSNGILKQESKSIMGVSVVTNYYREDIEPAEAMANTSSYAMSDMYYQPPGTLPPMVQPFDPTASKPLMLLTVSSEVKSGKELYDVAYYALRQMLSGIKGIIAPAAYGGSKRKIYVFVDPEKLQALNVSQTEIAEALQKNTTMIPSGIARIGKLTWGIDAQGMIKDVKDFNDIVVRYDKGIPVYIKDLGRVEDASAIQTNIVRIDGREQVYLPIFKRQKANTIAAVEAVKKALPKLQERLPEDVKLNVIFDQSSYVKTSINGLMAAGIGGVVLIVLVLLLFLGDFRSALIVAISLPLSVLFGMLVLYFTGQSINSITMGGIALVLGLLVDNSIVVIENIDRHLQMGKPPTKAAMDAAIEVAMPVLASTLVIIIVFFPVMFLTGIAKYLFSPLAITVAGTMVGSYIFSLTVIPLLAARFFKEKLPKSGEKTRVSAFQRLLNRLRDFYLRTLKWALKLRLFFILAAVLALLASLWFLRHTGYELFPNVDVGQMEIFVRLESGTSLRSTEKTIAQMEQIIREETGVDLKQLVSNIGVFYDLPAAYTPNSGPQDAFIKVQLKEDHAIPTPEYVRRLRQRFHRLPGVETSFNTGGMITAALNEGKTAPVDVQIKGNKLEVLQKIAKRIRDTIAQIPQARDVRILQRLDQPTKEVDIDRVKASQMGVEPVDAIKNIVSALNSSATFNKAFWIDEHNGNHYYVGVTYPENEIDKQDVINNVVVKSKLTGQVIPFKNFARVRETTAPVEINHHDLAREFNVYSNVSGTDIGSFSEEIIHRIEAMRSSFPRGYDVHFEGEVGVMKKSFNNLGLGLLLAVLLAFFVITPLFRSFKLAFIIIMAFPLGLIGVAALMGLTGTFLNIQTIMGIIMVVGISVSYGNILIDRMNSILAETGDKLQAILQGASNRFRPILMTMLTTVLGLLPTAMGWGRGTEVNQPLAIAVIGGTLAATFLAFFIIPILYYMFVKKK